MDSREQPQKTQILTHTYIVMLLVQPGYVTSSSAGVSQAAYIPPTQQSTQKVLHYPHFHSVYLHIFTHHPHSQFLDGEPGLNY